MKKYTFELTTEEVLAWRNGGDWTKFSKRMDELYSKVKDEHESEELNLPWRAIGRGKHWVVRNAKVVGDRNEKTAKLQSAAPELLEAVKAAAEYWKTQQSLVWIREVLPLIELALRKVATGEPELPGYVKTCSTECTGGRCCK